MATIGNNKSGNNKKMTQLSYYIDYRINWAKLKFSWDICEINFENKEDTLNGITY